MLSVSQTHVHVCVCVCVNSNFRCVTTLPHPNIIIVPYLCKIEINLNNIECYLYMPKKL